MLKDLFHYISIQWPQPPCRWRQLRKTQTPAHPVAKQSIMQKRSELWRKQKWGEVKNEPLSTSAAALEDTDLAEHWGLFAQRAFANIR